MSSDDLQPSTSDWYFDLQTEKATQTSEKTSMSSVTTLLTDCQSTNSHVENLRKDTSNTLFEYHQVERDSTNPNKVTIIEETVSEELQQSAVITGKETSNKIIYRKEIIKSVSKTKPELLEALLKEALESAGHKVPEYNLSADRPLTPVMKSNSVMDGDTVNDLETRPESNISVEQQVIEPKSPPTREDIKEVHEMTIMNPVSLTTLQPENDMISASPLEPEVSSTKNTSEQRTDFESRENPIVTTTDQQHPTAKSPQENNFVLQKNIPQIKSLHEGRSFQETHDATMAVIKVAIEDFVDKAYKKSHDAMSYLAGESIKQLKKMTNTENKVDNGIELAECNADESVAANSNRVVDNLNGQIDAHLSVLSATICENTPQCLKKSPGASENVNLGPKISSNSSGGSSPVEGEAEPKHLLFALKNKLYSIFSQHNNADDRGEN